MELHAYLQRAADRKQAVLNACLMLGASNRPFTMAEIRELSPDINRYTVMQKTQLLKTDGVIYATNSGGKYARWYLGEKLVDTPTMSAYEANIFNKLQAILRN